MEENDSTMTVEGLGHLLREERIRRGLSAEAIADRLKITTRVVRAIEDGDMKAMPHAVYACGFIRSYAMLLGIEKKYVQEVCAAIKIEESGPQARKSLVFSPLAKNISIFFSWVRVLLCLILLLGVLWYFRDTLPFTFFSSESNVVEQIDPLNDPSSTQRATSVVVSPPEHAVEPIAQKQSLTTETIPVHQEQIPELAVSEAQEKNAENRRELVSSPPEKHHIIISANSECWIHTTIDRKNITQRVLKKGESVTFFFLDQLVLKMGNAGGVKIVYDDHVTVPSGKAGQVKTITFPQDVQN